ncbi:MAG: ribosome small subunit-dependent GTPase A [Hyphomonadaceae bacterium]|nr:ribosome small subunit-dependent GTPase A [Hyphomonadaceae bacterium]
MIDLYGWSDALQASFAPQLELGRLPARVTAHHRGLWRVVSAEGERNARLSGRFALDAAQGEHPVVGDWLAASKADGSDELTIHALLPRASVFTRRAVSGGGVQYIAANIDVVVLVAALNGDLNLRRLERYLVAARESGAAPVIVLTKSDLAEDADALVAEVETIAGGAPVVALSARTGAGLDGLSPWLQPGQTAALLGSSGAGKSTLLNALAGTELMDTGAIRESDDRGRHTTTHRELFRLPGGALLIDTPGMREFGVLAEDAALEASFADVAELMTQCRFGDCAHVTEPGCAVLAARTAGSLSEERWHAFLKLQKELDFEARKDDPKAQAEKRAHWKQIHKSQRAKNKFRARSEES